MLLYRVLTVDRLRVLLSHVAGRVSHQTLHIIQPGSVPNGLGSEGMPQRNNLSLRMFVTDTYW